MQKHISKKRPVTKGAAKLHSRFKHEQPPEKLTYALAAYTAERRKDGWYVAKTVPSFNGAKPKWQGPFETIESTCLSMARHLSVELADRHTRSIEAHKIDRKHPLYGLKPTTRLRAR
jgi:2-polyprenyl-6-methoxyphenol hydroxylase-like FAD-dependent oxidoreductase